ncbi:unnamed protein product [Pieris brassicae]|uniref:TOG domain-containing protein n=1 Tax=Pieris brassicae TaxID=7116 RepID=A0A9P0TGS6_PIEBR|nr:unnamed protein product [Pieris brassicae]
MFIRKKSDGSMCPIVDLRELNRFVKTKHFRFDLPWGSSTRRLDDKNRFTTSLFASTGSEITPTFLKNQLQRAVIRNVMPSFWTSVSTTPFLCSIILGRGDLTFEGMSSVSLPSRLPSGQPRPLQVRFSGRGGRETLPKIRIGTNPKFRIPWNSLKTHQPPRVTKSARETKLRKLCRASLEASLSPGTDPLRQFNKMRPRRYQLLPQIVGQELMWWLGATHQTTPIHKEPATHFLATVALAWGWGAHLEDEDEDDIDTFSRTWHLHLAWVFPPPSLLARVLAHLNRVTGTYLILASDWPQGFWLQDLKSRSLDHPHEIYHLSKTLNDMTTALPPPQIQALTLNVWKIGGGSPEDVSACERRDDDSEASSVCSERSLDSYRRHDSLTWSSSRLGWDSSPPPPPSPDNIIALCACTHWTERKDGLTHLANYLNSGMLLTEEQLKRLTELLNKMFVDAHTKVFSLLLDAVCELLLVHAQNLKDWLYQLMLKLLTKLGTDILGSVQSKIMKTLDVIHEYYPAELQLYNIFRFLADSATAPTAKSKAAALKFLTDLARHYCTQNSLAVALQGGSTSVAGRALTKVANLANDSRSADVRTMARRALAALYDCNPVPFTALMSELPPDTQAMVNGVLQQHVRRTSSTGSDSPMRTSSTTSNPTNAEDVYSRIRKTTSEIHTYTAQHSNAECGNHMSSKDSGISQMSDATSSARGQNVPNGHYTGDIGRAASADSSEEANSTKESSPIPHRDCTHGHGDYTSANMARDKMKPHDMDENGLLITKAGLRETEVLEALSKVDVSKDPAEHCERLFVATHEILKYGECKKPCEYFKNILRVSLAAISVEENVADKENTDNATNSQSGWANAHERTTAEAVKVLIWLCRRPETRPQWLDYFDLILLKLINAYGAHSKEVMRAIDTGMPHIAAALPAQQVLALLKPVIRTKGYPSSLCALKLAAEVAKARSSELSDEIVSPIMEGVGQLADHQNSAVRKAAIFCMVAFTFALGKERMQPYYKYLSVSKLRLLDVYINKQKEEATKGGGS